MSKSKELTGRKVFAIVAGSFGVVIAVNLYMATSAVKTFPGLEVENSYVASQVFDAKAKGQRALGWTLTAGNTDGQFALAIVDADGLPAFPKALIVRIGRPTIETADQTLTLKIVDGKYVAPADLGEGKWYAYVEATSSNDVPFTQRIEFHVNGALPDWKLGAKYAGGQVILTITGADGKPVFPKSVQVQIERSSIVRTNVNAAAVVTDVDKDSTRAAPDVLHVRNGSPTIARDAQNVDMIRTGEGYAGQVALGAGKWYAYVDALSSKNVPLAQRLAFNVTGGNE